MTGALLGIMPRVEDCRIPEGAIIVRLKICECCGFLFTSDGDRYCRRCHSNPEPLARDVELAILQELMDQQSPLPQ